MQYEPALFLDICGELRRQASALVRLPVPAISNLALSICLSEFAPKPNGISSQVLSKCLTAIHSSDEAGVSFPVSLCAAVTLFPGFAQGNLELAAISKQWHVCCSDSIPNVFGVDLSSALARRRFHFQKGVIAPFNISLLGQSGRDDQCSKNCLCVDVVEAEHWTADVSGAIRLSTFRLFRKRLLES